MIKVRVIGYGLLPKKIKKVTLDGYVNIKKGITIKELLQELCIKDDEIMASFVNDTKVAFNRMLKDGDEIVLLPPIAGGAKKRFEVIDKKDNVATALEDIKKGSIIIHNESRISILDNIPRGHKFALKNIETNRKVIKYGQAIGKVTRYINCGEHVHVHNLVSLRGKGGCRQ